MMNAPRNRSLIPEASSPAASAGLMLAALLVLAAMTAATAQGQTYRVLYRFTGGTDGANPSASLIRDSAGNLYGTTTVGGAFNAGTVFKVGLTGKETVLYTFTGGADGAQPFAGLVRDAAGNLYGTASSGGVPCCGGVVFRVDTTGTETVLHSFTGEPDGYGPDAGLIRDSAGNLYGTTGNGGVHSNRGTVFKVDVAGAETVLHSFSGYPSDGAEPYAGLVRDAAGNFYGTTLEGGTSGHGTVFKLATTGRETVVYSFSGGADGSDPFGGLVVDAAGSLCGTTFGGGGYGAGTVFKVDTTGMETVLYSFTGGTDGAYPYGGLVVDPAGTLYGTTYVGGNTACGDDGGCGTVFELDTTGRETVLHSFAGGRDGQYPFAGLVRDTAGNLYGTTVYAGGGFAACKIGCGTVFVLKP